MCKDYYFREYESCEYHLIKVSTATRSCNKPSCVWSSNHKCPKGITHHWQCTVKAAARPFENTPETAEIRVADGKCEPCAKYPEDRRKAAEAAAARAEDRAAAMAKEVAEY